MLLKITMRNTLFTAKNQHCLSMVCYEQGNIHQYEQSTTQDLPKAQKDDKYAYGYNKSFEYNKAGFIFCQKQNDAKSQYNLFRKAVKI